LLLGADLARLRVIRNSPRCVRLAGRCAEFRFVTPAAQIAPGDV
jgi:hypothetical protein